MVAVTRNLFGSITVAHKPWAFFDYVDENGLNQMVVGTKALPAGIPQPIRARLDARVQVLQALPDLFEWRGAEPLRNPRDGVIEVGLDPEQGYVVALACLGPAEGDVTLLGLVRCRRGRVSLPDRQMARDRMRVVLANPSRVRDHVVG